MPQDGPERCNRPPARTEDVRPARTNKTADLEREIRAHLELDIEERIADGASADAARAAAYRAFGNVTRVREDARAVWVRPWVEQALQDVRYAGRRFTRAPGFALTAVMILTVGIGLNLAFFQLLNITALRPLAVADPATLVRFDRVTRMFSSNSLPYPATQFIRHHNDVLAAVLTWSGSESDVVWESDTTNRPRAAYVSANWFAELGYGAALGRVFVEAVDEGPSAPPVIVVSHAFWQTRLQGEPVVGRSVRINGQPATIIGVAPERFPGLRLDDAHVWLLIHQMDHFNPGIAVTDEWKSSNTHLYARLRPGISSAAASDGLRSTIRELARSQPGAFQPDESLVAYSGLQHFRGRREQRTLRSVALLAGGLMLMVLIVACANLSNLMLSNAINRLREFSVRAALGATRWRILRQQLIESLVIATISAAGGLLAGQWCARIIGTRISMPSYVDYTPDWRVVAAACAAAILATIAVGLVPSWMISRRDLIASMKDGGHQTSRGLARGRFRLFLIASQAAACCVLLIFAGMVVRGLHRMLTADPGFDFERVAVLDATLPRVGIQGDAARRYWEDVKRTLESTPQVERLSLTTQSPLGGGSTGRSVYNDAPTLTITTLTVEPSFFATLRIPIVAGRTFEAPDRAGAAVIVSRRVAEIMYGTLDVVGKGFPRSRPERTIVGVCGNAPLINVTATNIGQVYSPVAPDGYDHLMLLARARGDASALLPALRDAARAADERVLPKTSLPASQFAENVRDRRFASVIASLMGLLALALACFGIAGVVAHAVALRTKEIGIRRALGASDRAVIRLFLRQLATPVGTGMLAGTLVGLAGGRMLESDPFYLPGAGIGTPALVLILFTLTATIAALVPTLRALGTDPLHALRHE